MCTGERATPELTAGKQRSPVLTRKQPITSNTNGASRTIVASGMNGVFFFCGVARLVIVRFPTTHSARSRKADARTVHPKPICVKS